MGFVEGTSRPSIAPPGWTQPVAPVPAQAPPALAVDRAEAAVRWRLSAAIVDNILVYGGYLAVCALLHWRVASLDHVWVVVVAGIAYHFVLEAHDGQTIGKRQYGIRVVSLDGSPAGARAVAIRSVLRLVDQLLVCYLSGLVSMIRTGPARRQRIGDVVAGTTVIATDGLSARKGTPGWMLPAATLLALLASVAFAYAIAEAGNQPLTDAQRAQFITQCQSTAGQLIDCGCVLTQLEAAGYDTPNDLDNLIAEGEAQVSAGTIGSARAELMSAVGACRP